MTLDGTGWGGGRSTPSALVGLRLGLCNDMGVCPHHLVCVYRLISPFSLANSSAPRKITHEHQGSVAGGGGAVEARSSLLMT